jgi:hypothetical protein
MAPLGTSSVAEWFESIGCQIAQSKTVYKYLGCLMGIGLMAKDELDFLLSKMHKTFCHLSNNPLLMLGRAIYVKHILRAVLIYNLILFNYIKEGFRQLERISSQFVWATSAEGRAKKSLIAWSKILQPKEQGGLGLHPLMEQAKLLKIQNVSRLLDGWESKWSLMASDLIKQAQSTRTNRKETKV